MRWSRLVWALTALPFVAHCNPVERNFETGGEAGANGHGNEGGADGSSGGAKSTQDDPKGVGTLGASCTDEGALACEDHAQRFQLRCSDGEWIGNGTCPGGFHCDTSEENRGLCQPVISECQGKAGEPTCQGDDRVECSIDEISVTLLETCDACQPDACHCPAGMAVGDGDEPCTVCEPGTYSDTEDAKSCTLCPPGTVSRDANATSAASCLPAQVAAGYEHTCALLESGNVRCWGPGGTGMLGYGNTDPVGATNTPADAGDVNVGGTVQQIAAGRTHTCAVLKNGNVRCWGSSQWGRLGYGNGDSIGTTNTPADAGDVNVGGAVHQVSAGYEHTCALLKNGNVHCWGYYPRLGYGTQFSVGSTDTPADVGDVNVGGTVQQIAAGGHTCALLKNGNVRCWGGGAALGYGSTDSVGIEPGSTPADAGDVNVGGTVQQIATGGGHTCALLDNGNVRCWGSGEHGRLGYGNTDTIGDDETPSSVGDVNVGGTVRQIAAGDAHTCALLETGAVRCWGQGEYGQLGYGNAENVGATNTPADVGDVNVGGPVTQISAGYRHTCALLTNGNIRCWGIGADGRLGYGNEDDIGTEENRTPADLGDVPYL